MAIMDIQLYHFYNWLYDVDTDWWYYWIVYFFNNMACSKLFNVNAVPLLKFKRKTDF